MTLLLEIVSNHIAPILFVAGLGALFGRLFRPDIKPLAHLAFYVLSPCFLFGVLTTTTISGDELLRLAGFTIAVVGTAGLMAWCFGRALKMSARLISAIMLSCMFVNAGNYGTPLSLFAFGEEAMARSLILYVFSSMLFFSLGVIVASRGKDSLRKALVGLFRVPALYALALAGFTRWMGWTVPQFVDRPISLIGQSAIPVMLLILGMQIGRTRWSRRLSVIGIIVGIRMIIMPAVAVAFSSLLKLNGPSQQAAVSFTSMPTAVIVTILALEYDVKPDIVTESVVLTTLLSPFTLTPIIAFLHT